MAIDLDDTSEVRTLAVGSLADVVGGIGSMVVSPWFTMDPERTEEFEHATYLGEYANPYENEPGEGYGAGLVEGFHLLGMIDYLLNHTIENTGDFRAIPWNYGLDRVRFVSVVRHEDRFRLRGTLVAAEPKSTGLKVTFEITAEVDGRDEPAFVATQHALWVPFVAAHESANAGATESRGA